MADAPAYTTVPGKLPGLLQKIRETGVPEKANLAWLARVGFKSSNDRSMLGVLRQIGFIDGSGAPAPAWKQYRGADHKAVLGRAIQAGYKDLYDTYADAHSRSNTDLGHFFSAQTTAGKQSIDKMVSTFKTLAEQAEFGSSNAGTPDVTSAAARAAATVFEGTSMSPGAESKNAATGLNVNVNVELTLPETTDEKVYEAFFRAMRKHLLSDDPV